MDAHALISDSRNDIEAELGDVRLELHLDAAQAVICCDPAFLRDALLHLAEFGRSANGGVLSISTANARDAHDRLQVRLAFASDGITVPPVLSGTAKVTVSGTAVVGGTLTATVSDNTFPAGTQLSYQWGYSGGNYGSAIEGAGRTRHRVSATLGLSRAAARTSSTVTPECSAASISRRVAVRSISFDAPQHSTTSVPNPAQRAASAAVRNSIASSAASPSSNASPGTPSPVKPVA